MTKDERIILLDRELHEISDLFRGVQAIETIPEVLIDLLYQKAIQLAEGIEALKEEPVSSSVQAEPEQASKPVQPKPIQPVVVPLPVFEPIVEEPIVENPIIEQPVAEEPAQEQPLAVETPVEVNEAVEKPYFEQIYRSHDAEKVVSAKKEDFRHLLTLNDRFYFQKELFRGDVGMMNYVIDQVNQSEDLATAVDFLQKEFDWDKDSEAVTLFHELLQRHFN